MRTTLSGVTGPTPIRTFQDFQYQVSSIRQDTIKIFSKLDCHRRDEASRLYKDQQLKVQAAG
jgi:hypothetical protein